jgi:hypothetical protein
VGFPVATPTQVHAAAQQQPAQVATTTGVAAPAGAPVLGNEPGSILCTMLSANAAHRGQTPAGTTTSVTFEGQIYTRTATKVKYSVNSDINFYTSLGSLMDSGTNGGGIGENMLILSICEHSKVEISSISDTRVL